MGMDQYLLIPFLGGWTSIYQLFWCSPGVQGFDTLPYMYGINMDQLHEWDQKKHIADKGPLEFDSRVLGDLVLPQIVWYMFSNIYFFIYRILSIKVGSLGIY